ncbi:MAG: HAMP domain-containing histidine kinase [Phycisphaerales bacterium]|nr:HAMP domain-containing histidine kinase [Phycisphaerales bacterium]
MRLLDRVDDVQSRIDQFSALLEHHERLATLGTIAALIAHEFNNLLTPVMSYSQMALAKPEDRELCLKALQKSADGAERAAAIASAILGFARDDGGRATGRAAGAGPGVPRGTSEREVGGCSVREAAESALSCLARDLSKDGITLRVEVEDDVRVAMKSVALQHVLLNLVLNARNAMLVGAGSLTIRARRSEAMPSAPEGSVRSCDVPRGTVGGGGFVVIEVEDCGRGMNAEQLTNLFRTFFTSGARELTKPDRRAGWRGDRRGTGLGMTICKRLVEEVGGWMWVRSEEKVGTVVGVVVGEGKRDRG